MQGQAFISQIPLSAPQVAALFVFLGAAVALTRPEWILGFYLSAMLWTRTAVIGGVAMTWIVLAALAIATIRYMHERRGFLFTPQAINARDFGWLPRRDRWILVWMGLWWAWMILLVLQFDAESKIMILRPLLLNTILPLPLVLLIAADLGRLRGMATAYVLSSVVGCYLALQVHGITLGYLLRDPALEGTGLIRLGLRNYHFFSHFCAIAFILAMTLYLEARGLLRRALLLGAAAWLAYFVILAGARQSMSGALIVLALLLVWTLARGTPALSVRALVLTGAVALLVGWLYATAPQLIVRADEGGSLINSFNIFADRGWLWLLGWSFFLRSPVWGLGFEQTIYSHNVFVGTLSDQGLVGMVFFLGYLAFVLRLLPGVWMRSADDPRALWRAAMFGIFVFAMVHGQAAGTTNMTAHLYWPIAALWWLGQDIPRPAPRPVAVGSVAGRPILRRPIAGRSPNA